MATTLPDAPPEEVAAATAYENLHVPSLFRQWAPRVLDAAGVRSGERVLDVACGTGVLAREATARVGPSGGVAGVDPGAGMLAVAAQLEPGVEWRQGTAEALPYPDDVFDVTASSTSPPASSASCSSPIASRRCARCGA
jgi:ubiquinone/menaquinone biosynthesis C-methylase UbiE